MDVPKLVNHALVQTKERGEEKRQRFHQAALRIGY
jgi:hypothetical protein